MPGPYPTFAVAFEIFQEELKRIIQEELRNAPSSANKAESGASIDIEELREKITRDIGEDLIIWHTILKKEMQIMLQEYISAQASQQGESVSPDFQRDWDAAKKEVAENERKLNERQALRTQKHPERPVSLKELFESIVSFVTQTPIGTSPDSHSSPRTIRQSRRTQDEKQPSPSSQWPPIKRDQSKQNDEPQVLSNEPAWLSQMRDEQTPVQQKSYVDESKSPPQTIMTARSSAPSPKQKHTCASCGFVMTSVVTPSFCQECGTTYSTGETNENPPWTQSPQQPSDNPHNW